MESFELLESQSVDSLAVDCDGGDGGDEGEAELSVWPEERRAR